MAITEETVKKVAKLSCLELNEEELHKMKQQISDILDYVEQLSKIPTEGVKPTSHVHGVTNAFRDDVVKESLPVEKVQKIAPDFRSGSFCVPKIIG
ncbi:MAG: Asp-tRNA(Asn)/Glu-tRNA(Gln) amidotransferase subunit GatC [Deltaproteobacteria bacterium]|nr:Asp-tRNA(Asn)/Glu-tRNA(Gln) amidotransferase subunit GatC [Deltaproteobacteria bacterium]